MNYIANKILMVRPASFAFNPQTVESNAFQIQIDLSDDQVQAKALTEFDAIVKGLRGFGIEVIVVDDKKEPYTPDSIFPNNWFSTHIDGTLCLYPMEANARRFERSPQTIDEIKKNINLTRTLDFTNYEAENKFLEGTGSLILDHENKLAYASISSRTDEDVLDAWAKTLGFKAIKFHSFDKNGKAIYHTNVMMCLGDKFAVICLKSILDENEKKLVTESLHRTNREIIDISFEQLNSFAGNMLLLKNSDENKFLVMSKSAHRSLNKTQIEILKRYATLISFDIDIIQKCGGGSVRCMIAEIF